mgnify:CR=1 FL=1
MHLQSDNTAGRHGVFDVGTGHTVDPGFQRIAPAFDAVLVPLIVFEGFAGNGIHGDIGDVIAASGFIINTAGFARFVGGNFSLVPIDTAVGQCFGGRITFFVLKDKGGGT